MYKKIIVSAVLALFSIFSYILIVIPKKMTSLYPEYKLPSKVE